MKDSDEVEIVSVKPSGYDFRNITRKDRSGGGMGIFFKNNIRLNIVKFGECASVEHVQADIMINNFYVTVVAIYRPAFSEQHLLQHKYFLKTLQRDFISEKFLSHTYLFVGDFNVHVNDPEDADAAALNDLFNMFSLSQMVSTPSLSQMVSTPTHTSGNTLDLFLV